jgi:hypothetical protein
MNTFEVELEAAAEASQLAAQIVQQGWGLQQLTPQDLDLEQIFLRVTTGEPIS